MSKQLPAQGLSRESIAASLESFRANDLDWRDGRVFAYVYDPGPDAEAVIKHAYMSYLSENGLDPTVFPSTLRMENDVIGLSATHLRGGPEVQGSFTSGGTESVILALKTAREFGRKVRGIKEPRVIVPTTAHAAFHKAAHYLDMPLDVIPVVAGTFKADVAAMRAAITPDTVLLVGSAVSYAHGVCDPIRELGALALEKDLLLHVDGCIGAFVLPLWRKLGVDVPDFDFTVPGVTSISMDLHKYGFAAKGASVVLYKDAALRKHQLYSCSDWTGYTIINATVQSSKSAGPVAGAWAALHFLGEDGYLKLASDMLDATRAMVDGIKRIPGLRLLGAPESNLVCFTSDDVDVFHISDEMRVRGWFVQPQLAFGNSPSNLHLSLSPKAKAAAPKFLADLADAVVAARTLTENGKGDAADLKQMVAMLAETGLGPDQIEMLLGSAGVEGSDLPPRMAVVNQVLDGLPPALRNQLLLEFLNSLFKAA